MLSSLSPSGSPSTPPKSSSSFCGVGEYGRTGECTGEEGIVGRIGEREEGPRGDVPMSLLFKGTSGDSEVSNFLFLGGIVFT